jgi:hypothetical protein
MAAHLHVEGSTYIFTTQLAAANLSIGLCTDASLAVDATMASLTRVTGTGYADIVVSTLTAGTVANGSKVTTDQVTFTGGTGGWTGAKTVFIVTSTNKLLCSVPLSTTRTLALNDTLKLVIEIDLTG